VIEQRGTNSIHRPDLRHNVKAVDLADLWGPYMTTSKNDDKAPLKSDKPSWDFRFAEALIPGVRYRVHAISPDGVTFDFDINTDGRLSNLYFKSAGRFKNQLRQPPDVLNSSRKQWAVLVPV
jgi:hypothetical protein